MTFTIPKQPKIKLKAKPPDQRKIAVVPLRALRDKDLDNQSIRVLGLICSYANRAGITWVSNKKLSEELQVSKQAISHQVVALKKKGYLEVVKKGYMGQRTDTLRVVFDPSISTQDALGILGNSDEYKSPLMLKEELETMNKPILNKAIKKPKAIAKTNKVKPQLEDNKTEQIGMLYVKWFKDKKVISENDLKAIDMVTDWDKFIADLEVEFKMIASEGLRKPEDILAITTRILVGKGL
jgi:predicted DNA-binding transcriptional regulator